MWIQEQKPALVLAPMEGVTDAPMRDLLTELGGFDFCVTEFLRVNREIPPKKVFYRHVPEISKGSKTRSGVPTQVQLLGGDPQCLAETAQRAITLGVQAIDLNFGCPAPTVNRHDGGASLLKFPDRIKAIVSACRSAVPASIPVSAKLRLGWDNIQDIFLNAEKATEGGASWITIHARTRAQGYAPPVHWKIIGEVRKRVGIPVVANGDIWSLDDFLRCEQETGCIHFMLGRGALANPFLSQQIGHRLKVQGHDKFHESEFGVNAKDWLALLVRFSKTAEPFAMRPGFIPQKIKQWVNLARLKQEVPWFDSVKRVESVDEIFRVLENYSAS